MQIVTSTTAKELEIREVSKKDNEYVLLKALQDCNLNNYAVTDNTYDQEGSTSNKHPHLYWFPKVQVKKDELIFLYSGKGTNSRGEAGGRAYHVFYWQLAVRVWNDKRDNAILLKVAQIQKKAV